MPVGRRLAANRLLTVMTLASDTLAVRLASAGLGDMSLFPWATAEPLASYLSRRAIRAVATMATGANH